jgi:hypothetical protein
MKTLQEWFNDAYTGLASQGFERSMEGVACKYQSEIGCCTVGWGMPEELRKTADEDKMSLTEIVSAAKEDPFLVHYLNILQCVHDVSCYPEIMKDKLNEYAAEYNLAVPALS